MDDLNFPIFDKPLPPTKPVSTEAYVEFLLWVLNHIGTKELRRQLEERTIPTGKRFTLFPES